MFEWIEFKKENAGAGAQDSLIEAQDTNLCGSRLNRRRKNPLARHSSQGEIERCAGPPLRFEIYRQTYDRLHKNIIYSRLERPRAFGLGAYVGSLDKADLGTLLDGPSHRWKVLRVCGGHVILIPSFIGGVLVLETVAVPILLKAVDFLFGEGSKILGERRERRKSEVQASEVKPGGVLSSSSNAAVPTLMIQSKDGALSQSVVESTWSNSEANIKHLMSLLEIYTKNYYLAKQQYAKWGSALVPPIIVNNLNEAENDIAKSTKQLQAALSQIYGKRVVAVEVEQA